MLAIMNRLAMLLLVCGACGGGDDFELYPVNPGGGGVSTGVGGGSGGSNVDGDAGVELTGRVCLIVDARTPTTNCAVTGADGLTVTLGTRTATTMANGDFTIRVISGTNNVWSVTGTGIVPSAMTFTGSNTIPALTTQTFADMVTTNAASVPAGSGSIIARLASNNAALTDAKVTTTPPPPGNVFYDAADAITWDQTSTGTLGVAWVPGIAPTATASMTVTNAAAESTMFMNIPVFADTITWVTANVP
jgi:hypothetical protein